MCVDGLAFGIDPDSVGMVGAFILELLVNQSGIFLDPILACVYLDV
jgi:hypothetical protein